MTIQDAIDRTDSLKYNTYTNDEKIAWLSKLDAMVKQLIIDTHEGGEDIVFAGYDASTDMGKELIVPEPYDEMYILWLQAKIDLANCEYDKYNASITMFNTEYEAFESYYNRNHMPLSDGSRFRF